MLRLGRLKRVFMQTALLKAVKSPVEILDTIELCHELFKSYSIERVF